MAVVASVVTVGTTPTPLTTAQTDTYSGAGWDVLVPTGGATVYIGGPGVTTSTGRPLAAGEHATVELDLNETLYGVVAVGTQNVNVFAVGV